MTREQRNALAELIVAALQNAAADRALRALARVIETPATIDADAVSRLASAGFVTVDRDAASGPGTSGAAGGKRVRLAPAYAAIVAELRDRVTRAIAASDAHAERIHGAGAASRSTAAPGHAHATTATAGAVDACLERSAALFNARLYFEVHEELEALWKVVRGETRIVVQGLLQIAVALHHAEHGNVAGAQHLFAAGRAKIAPHAPTWHRVAIAALLTDVDRFVACLVAGREAPPPQLLLVERA